MVDSSLFISGEYVYKFIQVLRPSSESVGLLFLGIIIVVDGGAVSGGLGAAPVVAVAVLLHLGPGAVVVEGIEGPGGGGGEGG